jgi:hypothetical protein
MFHVNKCFYSVQKQFEMAHICIPLFHMCRDKIIELHVVDYMMSMNNLLMTHFCNEGW